MRLSKAKPVKLQNLIFNFNNGISVKFEWI